MLDSKGDNMYQLTVFAKDGKAIAVFGPTHDQASTTFKTLARAEFVAGKWAKTFGYGWYIRHLEGV